MSKKNFNEIFDSFESEQDGECSICGAKKFTLFDKVCQLYACKDCSLHLINSHSLLDAARKIGITHPTKDKYE